MGGQKAGVGEGCGDTKLDSFFLIIEGGAEKW